MKRVIFFLIIACAACKEAYDPPVISTNHAYLVVEGFINNGPDSTIFTLSRTFPLNDSGGTAPPELNAQVNIQGTDNSVYPLTELGNGNYGAAALALNAAQQYRLMIVTTDGKQYQSDYVPLKTSPPIDSVNWVNSPNGLQIYANTHDPQSQSHYYRWTYTETWQFHSVEYSGLEYTNGSLQERNPNTIYICWLSDNSTNILLGSSAKLEKDNIFESPLVLIPPNSWEIGVKYSILVNQYVLTADAYDFWQNLQITTEQIGSIFSPQPSTAKGNIHCITDTTESVIGYISAGTMVKQRIFITPDQIPNWMVENYLDACTVQNTSTAPDSLAFFLGSGINIPIFYTPDTPPYSRVDYAGSFCVDCTILGTNIKPSFWQ